MDFAGRFNISLNMTDACVAIDDTIDTIVGASESMYAASRIASASILFATSVAVAFAGARLLRPLAASLGALAGFWVGYIVFGQRADTNCSARLAAGGGAALALAFVAMCVLDTALFLLGAVGAGAFAHALYVPELDELLLRDEAAPRLGGRSVVHLALVGTAAFLGGIYVRCRGPRVLKAATGALGGAGAGYATMLLAQGESARYIGVGVGVVVGLGGFWIQRRGLKRKQVAKDSKV